MIDLEEKARSLGGRQRGDSDEAKDRVYLLRVIQTRQRILRRLIDSILWQILHPEERALRYFAVDDRLHPIDPPVLMRMADIAHQRNHKDRLKFNIVCDLTTAVHIIEAGEALHPAPLLRYLLRRCAGSQSCPSTVTTAR